MIMMRSTHLTFSKSNLHDLSLVFQVAYMLPFLYDFLSSNQLYYYIWHKIVQVSWE